MKPSKPAPVDAPAPATTKSGPVAQPEPAYSPVEPPHAQLRSPLRHEHLPWDTEEGVCNSGDCAPQDCWVSTWGKMDFLLWWRSGQNLPPLVTTSPTGTAQGIAGEYGRPTTSVLYGDGTEDYAVRPGARLELGTWFDRTECWGLGGRFFWLGDAESNFAAASTGTPILAIPFTEGSNNTPDARLIGFPGTFNGNLNVQMTSEYMAGDAYLRTQWCQMQWGRLDLLAGYQFARFNEGLVMDSTVSDIGGASNRLVDSFRTTNEFHGGQIGFIANVDRGCWYYDVTGKIGLGNMSETVTITGQSISRVGSTQFVLPNSGLFAQPTNVGTYTEEKFVAIPEIGLNVGWRATNCLDFNIGYTFIYYSSVARPGDVIDTTVNTSQAGGPLVGPARPAFKFNDSDLVIHGLNFGATLKW